MYQLATLRCPPRPIAFQASAIGGRSTYGPDLEGVAYSNTLKRLIWRCLCERPRDRPQLNMLHKEIATCIIAIKGFPLSETEIWSPPEPLGPPQETPPAEAVRPVTPTGTEAAPFIIEGRPPSENPPVISRSFKFFVKLGICVPGHPRAFWFRASENSTLGDLKDNIPNFGYTIPPDRQLFHLRLHGPTRRRITDNLDNLWGCGVRHGSQIVLDEIEDEEEFTV